MVKVTFNSALAQKEAKKDDPKSGEEALIIPGRRRGGLQGPR